MYYNYPTQEVKLGLLKKMPKYSVYGLVAMHLHENLAAKPTSAIKFEDFPEPSPFFVYSNLKTIMVIE